MLGAKLFYLCFKIVLLSYKSTFQNMQDMCKLSQMLAHNKIICINNVWWWHTTDAKHVSINLCFISQVVSNCKNKSNLTACNNVTSKVPLSVRAECACLYLHRFPCTCHSFSVFTSILQHSDAIMYVIKVQYHAAGRVKWFKQILQKLYC
jgi:hypothetical protein